MVSTNMSCTHAMCDSVLYSIYFTYALYIYIVGMYIYVHTFVSVIFDSVACTC